jgi:predicted kinase
MKMERNKEVFDIIDYLIDQETYEVKWDNVLMIEPFHHLKDGGFHSKYHKEGNSFIHTQMVVDSMKRLNFRWESTDHNYKIIMLLAAIFHDIGKAETAVLKENGDWSAHNHVVNGEKITRFILWDIPFQMREIVCSLVRYHMLPLDFLRKNNSERIKSIMKISMDVEFDKLCFLCKSDILGSYSDDVDERLNTIEIMSKMAADIGYLHASMEVTPFQKFFTFNEGLFKNKTVSTNLDIHDQLKITIMCGIPGGGKTHCIKTHFPNTRVISRDLTRIELGYIDENGKFLGNPEQEQKVSEIVNQQIIECCENNISFIYDNMNTKKKYRDEFINKVIQYNPIINIVYCETFKQTHLERRDGQIDRNIIFKMMREMEMPTQDECYSLLWRRT